MNAVRAFFGWWPLTCMLQQAMPRAAGRIASITVAAVACFAGAARADTVEIDLSGFVNADLTTYTGGFNYPQHGGTITVDSIPFQLATIGSQQDTAIIQTNGVQDYSIPVGIFGVTSVDVLVNSAYGSCGTDVGEIDFVGSSQTFSYNLTEGVNIRDHFNGNFCNVAGSIAGTASFGAGSDRLDLDSILLPASFSDQTLESIDFEGFGKGELGEPFLAAATIVTPGDPDPAAVPEPSSFLFLIVASAIVALRRIL